VEVSESRDVSRAAIGQGEWLVVPKYLCRP